MLSALCGATLARTGASCGLVYLFGGGPEQIGYQIDYTVNNMMGCVTGMLCNVAKADCAMKVGIQFFHFVLLKTASADPAWKPMKG